MNLGRPAMVSISLADSVPLPLEIDRDYLDPSGVGDRVDKTNDVLPQSSSHLPIISFFILSAQLYSIMQHILLSFYSNDNSSQLHDYDGYFTGPDSVFQIDSELMKWCKTIPNHLRLDSAITAEEQQERRNLIFHRQAIVLWARSESIFLPPPQSPRCAASATSLRVVTNMYAS
jgi:hypothetical protein